MTLGLPLLEPTTELSKERSAAVELGGSVCISCPTLIIGRPGGGDSEASPPPPTRRLLCARKRTGEDARDLQVDGHLDVGRLLGQRVLISARSQRQSGARSGDGQLQPRTFRAIRRRSLRGEVQPGASSRREGVRTLTFTSRARARSGADVGRDVGSWPRIPQIVAMEQVYEGTRTCPGQPVIGNHPDSPCPSRPAILPWPVRRWCSPGPRTSQRGRNNRRLA